MKPTSRLDWVSQAGIRVIKDNQDVSGAFLASPNFRVYRYSWVRDGSYIAMALSQAGERQASAAFHNWTARAVTSQADKITALSKAARQGRQLDQRLFLPTRYLVDGSVETGGDSWPNTQFDGYGTWLWALADHLGGKPVSQEQAVVLAADYLASVWQLPCYDYWEEFGDRQHTSTLAAIAAGLRAAADLTGKPRYGQVAQDVWAWVLEHCVKDGMFVKGPQDSRVDASLLSLAVPLGLTAVDDPVYAATLARIEAELVSPAGGVWRYLGDSYFGGGAWVLLACWLGLAQLKSGRAAAAQASLGWASGFASSAGWLPEQITDPDHTQQPEWRTPWAEKWGEPANPLLWSQAMYILLDDRLARVDAEDSSSTDKSSIMAMADPGRRGR
ncbi:MAG: hypothetical protein LBU38_07560 [Propionibacteriaceae bacterium]|jgi:GH15 family glucan-1,4-alpha-glucosidase|nr:hypothetical protein [Propionibacteriaceae bacterium]